MEKKFVNGNIWVDGEYHKWMIVNGNKIVDIGSNHHEHSDEIIDLEGNYVFPGLIDSHIHVFGLGRMKYRLRLNKPRSIAELQNRLEKYVKNNKEAEWIIGHNWDQDYFEDKRYPTSEDLDFIVSNRPVVLFRACNHIAVLNSLALKIIGVDKNTAYIEGGMIDVDGNGYPNGILRENALRLVTPFLQPSDKEFKKKLLKIGLDQCLKVGLTSVQTNDPDAWDLYKELAEENELPIRVYLTIFHKELENIKFKAGERVKLLSCDRVKIISDGSLGAHTAALRENYTDTGDRGIPIYNQLALNNAVRTAHKQGFRLEVHAIGDKAAEMSLQSFEKCKLSKLDRPILTHCQVLAKDLIDKMNEMGVIANIQPTFVSTDSQWIEKRLGKNRLDYAYGWKTLIDKGIHVAGGSDAPIEDNNPLKGMFDAIFRHNPRGETWRKDQCLEFDEALRIYTSGGAYAMKEEDRLGSLEKGKLADFIIIDKDIANHPETLIDATILEVWVNGKCRYSQN